VRRSVAGVKQRAGPRAYEDVRDYFPVARLILLPDLDVFALVENRLSIRSGDAELVSARRIAELAAFCGDRRGGLPRKRKSRRSDHLSPRLFDRRLALRHRRVGGEEIRVIGVEGRNSVQVFGRYRLNPRDIGVSKSLFIFGAVVRCRCRAEASENDNQGGDEMSHVSVLDRASSYRRLRRCVSRLSISDLLNTENAGIRPCPLAMSVANRLG